jgi:putative ABC transport system substrate-binding protein
MVARAQQPGERIRRIGVLQDTAEDDPQRKKQFARFRDGLASFGWLEGRTVRIDYRFAAADSNRYQPLAKELVALQPEVILVVSTPATATLQQRGRSRRAHTGRCRGRKRHRCHQYGQRVEFKATCAAARPVL